MSVCSCRWPRAACYRSVFLFYDIINIIIIVVILQCFNNSTQSFSWVSLSTGDFYSSVVNRAFRALCTVQFEYILNGAIIHVEGSSDGRNRRRGKESERKRDAIRPTTFSRRAGCRHRQISDLLWLIRLDVKSLCELTETMMGNLYDGKLVVDTIRAWLLFHEKFGKSLLLQTFARESGNHRQSG